MHQMVDDLSVVFLRNQTRTAAATTTTTTATATFRVILFFLGLKNVFSRCGKWLGIKLRSKNWANLTKLTKI